MREKFSALVFVVPFVFCATFMNSARASTTPKDWTLLVYLNGNNNLDDFGTMNLKQMETVGSNDSINIVVQWASESAGTVKRLLVQKSTDPSSVTSPILQDMGQVDMGDYHNLVAFIQWGAQSYPANHYIVDVWDHGSGFHKLEALKLRRQRGAVGGILHPLDISFDDNSGNSITTKQLGEALAEGAKAIGHKVDVYGSDACLMGMAEVAAEMKDSVLFFEGSQQVEPGAGWPYDKILAHWATRSTISPKDAASIIATEYAQSYMPGGSNAGDGGPQDATGAAYDLGQIDALEQAVQAFGAEVMKMDANSRAQVVKAASQAVSFTDDDYRDLQGFVSAINSAGLSSFDMSTANDVISALSQFVVANSTTDSYKQTAHGVSIWLPSGMDEYNSYSDLYTTLDFESATHWGEALKYLLQDSRRNHRLP